MIPQLTQLKPNLTLLSFGWVQLWYSYETPIAARVPGLGIIGTDDPAFSRSTVRHRSWLRINDRPHLPREAFATILNEALSLANSNETHTEGDISRAALITWTRLHERAVA